MNDFLERVRADPDDDRLRAVYADWLLEQGDERGEFIALQLKRAARGSTPDDLRRERELLSTNWFRWSGPLAKALHRDESTFERGFLTHVTMPRVSTPKKLLKALVGDPHWSTVRTVRNVHINEHYRSILLHPVMHRLRGASMDGEELLELTSAPWRLTELSLRAWELHEEHPRILREAEPFTQLRRIELQTTSFEDLLRFEPTLERLDRLSVFLRNDTEAKPLMKLVASKKRRETIVDSHNYGVSVTDGRLDLVVKDFAPPVLEAVMALARLARSSGLSPGALSWSARRWVEIAEPPENWAKPFESRGFKQKV